MELFSSRPSVDSRKGLAGVTIYVAELLICNALTPIFFLLLSFFNADNLKPFVPLGQASIINGATQCFFGYIGYDEICCVSGEAINPRKNLPRAILLTLLIVTFFYILATLALVGMQPSSLIDPNSGFPVAFQYNGANVLAQIEAAGEVITLPVVVLIAQLAQPRLQQAMARDGLLPEIFARLNRKGNLFWSNVIAGVVMVVIATFVPFDQLNDFITAGILLGFSMTNSCLILLKRDSPIQRPHFLPQSLLTFHAFCLMTGMVMSKGNCSVAVKVIFGSLTIIIALVIGIFCPKTKRFGGYALRESDRDFAAAEEGSDEGDFFEAPMLPYLPLFGIFVNWYLFSQLGSHGLAIVLGFLVIVSGLYLTFCSKDGQERQLVWNSTIAEKLVDETATSSVNVVKQKDIVKDDIEPVKANDCEPEHAIAE